VLSSEHRGKEVYLRPNRFAVLEALDALATKYTMSSKPQHRGADYTGNHRGKQMKMDTGMNPLFSFDFSVFLCALCASVLA
jgi:hypothetical protein